MGVAAKRTAGLRLLCLSAVGVAMTIATYCVVAPFVHASPPTLGVHVFHPTLHSASKRQHVILVRARTRPSAICRAVVRVRRVKVPLMRVKSDDRGQVAWRWLILPSSPSGTWRITVACRHDGLSGSASTSVLVITESKRSKGPIGDPRSLHTPHGTLAGKGGGVCGPFEPGQCTCLAYQKRPDVYTTAVSHGVPAGGRRAAGPEFYVWDGEQWLVNAQRAGIPTGGQPVAGALAVWGVPNSAAYGHVAYVEQVSSPTRVLISECNYDWHGSCRTIWENPQAAANFQGYVYGGPAGNGPGRSPGGSPGSSPGSSGGGGGYEMAFQANTGELISIGSAGGTNWHQGMMGGTSPSIAALSSGGYEMAFQANTGELISIGTAGGTNWHQGMMSGTSPSITGYPVAVMRWPSRPTPGN